jgi:hypothetical protein
MKTSFYDQTVVVARTSHFVMLTVPDGKGFDSFEEFVKFLYDNNFKRSCGYNKSKKGYMETLRFLYELYYNRKGGE